MATATRKRTTTLRTSATAKRRRSTASTVAGRRKTKSTSGKFANFIVPAVFCLGILFCLGFLGLMGYRTVTASVFFDVKNVEVRGTSRVSKDEVQRIVAAQTERSGVWNADLGEIKSRVEKLSYVKSVAVSRILPDGIRVTINERVPKAAVHLDTGDVWVDEDAQVLGVIGKNEEKPAFIMRGWEIVNSESAAKNNQLRVKVYQKMTDDWREFDLARRVQSVDLSDPLKPQVTVKDSNDVKTIILPKDSFSKNLQTGIESLAGRNPEIIGVDVTQTPPGLLFKK